MKEKKNIDRLFQEKFKDFEKNPPEGVWSSIKDELSDRKKRRVVPLWFKLAGVAAILAIVIVLGGYLFTADQEESKVVDSSREKPIERPQNASNPSEIKRLKSGLNTLKTDTSAYTITPSPRSKSREENTNRLNPSVTVQQNRDRDSGKITKPSAASAIARSAKGQNIHEESSGTHPSESNRPSKTVEKKSSDLTTKTPSSRSKNAKKITERHRADLKEDDGELVENSGVKTTANEEDDWQQKALDNFQISDNDHNDHSKTDQLAKSQNDSLKTAEEKDKPSIFDDIAKNNDEEEASGEKTVENAMQKRLALRPNIAPIYYGSLNGGSAIDPKFGDNSAKGEVTMAYGINLSYAVSDRIKIRSGVSKVNMNYNTSDVAFTSSTHADNLKGLAETPQTKNIAIISKRQKITEAHEIKGNSVVPYTEGKLNQQMSYIEVPFEVEYAVLDRRFSINLIGGASSLFLNDDAVRIDSPIGTTDLGRADNLNSVSFTTNVGFGLGYQLTDALNFNIEPTFKYQFDGFSGHTDFRPYYFGVYSGVSFKF